MELIHKNSGFVSWVRIKFQTAFRNKSYKHVLKSDYYKSYVKLNNTANLF